MLLSEDVSTPLPSQFQIRKLDSGEAKGLGSKCPSWLSLGSDPESDFGASSFTTHDICKWRLIVFHEQILLFHSIIIWRFLVMQLEMEQT